MGSSKPMRNDIVRNTHVPGEPGLWVFIFGDMSVFAFFFAVYAYYRGLDVETFNQNQLLLNQNLGAINTFLLLLSSWLVVLGIEAYRHNKLSRSAFLLRGALLCGLGFAGVKVYEYADKVSDGITLTSSVFFSFYYVLTGIHFLHLLVGLVLLSTMIATVNKQIAGRDAFLVGGACYWHMVDLLWVVLFPLLYLVR